jgi:hypothetical protein
LPALDMAEELLTPDMSNDTCALLLLFLSDGKPSDKMIKGGEAVATRINDRMRALALKFGNRLLLGTIGFANADEEFSLLKSMAVSAKEGGAQSLFVKATSAGKLGSAITSLVSTLTQTETRISNIGAVPRTVRPELPEKEDCLTTFDVKGWHVHNVGVERHELRSGHWVKVGLHDSKSIGVVVRKKYFGIGSERIVYELREISFANAAQNSYALEDKRRAAKEHKYATDEKLKMDFHKVFCETQMRAHVLAKMFNLALQPLLQARGYLISNIARIEFLECCVYTFTDNAGYECGLLVEDMLDDEDYTKWNGNNGFVKGAKAHDSISALVKGMASLDMQETVPVMQDTSRPSDLAFRLEDYLQTFSHFTYWKSKRKFLVCDLQGVLVKGVGHMGRPVFRLTDPAIHYASAKGRKNVNGRTDHGQKGFTKSTPFLSLTHIHHHIHKHTFTHTCTHAHTHTHTHRHTPTRAHL